MSQHLGQRNSVQPLRNVAAMMMLIKELQGRQYGLPGMAAFYGPPGYGKTYAAIHAVNTLDAIHISVQKLWTAKTLLKQVLIELGATPAKTLADMQIQANECLALAARPLIIDEADYAVSRNLVEIIRDLHDGSFVPVILIGMEKLPQKLRRWELINSRILEWVPAQPANLKDARFLAGYYAADLAIDDALLERIIKKNTGNIRETVKALAQVTKQSRLMPTLLHGRQ